MLPSLLVKMIGERFLGMRHVICIRNKIYPIWISLGYDEKRLESSVATDILLTC